MAQGGRLISLGTLLDERAASEEDDVTLERIKTLAQEHLPCGWISWEVLDASKHEIFGDSIDPSVLNKLTFALPTVSLVRAFDPEADHLSEKGYRAIRLKLLDWAFSRALIIGPAAISNRIRGSAGRTELFKESIEPLRPLLHTRMEANRIQSHVASESEESTRGQRSRSASSHGPPPPKKRKRSPSPADSSVNRIEALERKMEGMFSLLLEKIEDRTSVATDSDKENYADSDEDSQASEDSFEVRQLEFLPSVKQAEPLVREPSPQIAREGIECQRLGMEGWNRIRYKEVEKRLQAAPIFSALKTNVELASLSQLPHPWLAKQEDMLGAITHGLLLQRKALTEALNSFVKKFPTASEDLQRLLSDSAFKESSDELLQFVCAHRAELIEKRRKLFTARNSALNEELHSIVPSSTHLFEAKNLASFVKDNGGPAQVFRQRKEDKPQTKFRKPLPPSKPSRPSTSTFRPPSKRPSTKQSRPNRPAPKNARTGRVQRNKGRAY